MDRFDLEADLIEADLIEADMQRAEHDLARRRERTTTTFCLVACGALFWGTCAAWAGFSLEPDGSVASILIGWLVAVPLTVALIIVAVGTFAWLTRGN